MTDSDIVRCSRCRALVKRTERPDHYRWHTKVEPHLKEPTSECGWWDEETGAWENNSRDWL